MVPPRTDQAELDDTVSPRVAQDPVRLKSHYDCLMKAMADADEDGEQLVQLLYGPTTEHWWAPDGTLMMSAVTQEECEDKLDFALELLQGARQHATGGATTAHPLTKHEMDLGLAWLKDVYREHHLTRPNLGEALDDWHAGYHFSSEAKTAMRSDFRSGFRTFLRDTVGDASVAIAILRHGYNTSQALTSIVRETFHARKELREERDKRPPPPTRRTHPELAEAAQAARRQYARGHKIAMAIKNTEIPIENLDFDEQEMYRHFRSGHLWKEMVFANKAFGHGLGAKEAVSVEQLASHVVNHSFKSG